jgi:ubiquitin related modifier 1
MSELALKIEFGGGLELLFSNKRSHRVSLPAAIPVSSSPARAGATDASSDAKSTKPTDINFLITWLRDNLLRERAELFVEEGTVYVSSSRLIQAVWLTD